MPLPWFQADEEGVPLQAVSAVGALQVSSHLSQELSWGCLDQSDSLPVICVWLRKMSPMRYPFSYLVFLPLFILFSLFVFCGMCPWKQSLSGSQLCCGRPCPVIESHLSEHRSGFLTANATIKHIPSLFAFCRGSPGSMISIFLWLCWPQALPDVVLAGWAKGFSCCSSCLV